MSRKFNREMKKLNKLHDRSDIDVQREKVASYNRRAKTGLKVAGVGAAIAGAGAAAEYGGANLRNKLVKDALRVSKDAEWNAKDLSSKQYFNEWDFWDKQRQGLDGTELSNTFNKIYTRNQDRAWETHSKNVKAIEAAGRNERSQILGNYGLASQIHKGVMTAGAAVAVVGGGIAAYNKIQSSIAKKRMTDIGHEKALAKYKAQVDKMKEMFKNTPYSNLIKK